MAEGQSTPVSSVEYRDIPDYPGYRVGDDGSVWCQRSRNGKGGEVGPWRQLRPRAMKTGYLTVTLRKGNAGVRVLVHKLVLTAFVGPCPVGMEACHFPDRSPANNRLTNLRWDTHTANMADKVAHGTNRRGEQHPSAKLTAGQVREIRTLYAAGGVSHAQLGRRFGVDRETIGNVVRLESWGHL